MVAIIGSTIVLLLGLVAGGAFLYYRSVDSGIQRTDAFGTDGQQTQQEAARPPVEVVGAKNLLLLGSDSRAPDDPNSRGKAGAGRTDAIILLHIDAAHQRAYLISLPRDLYVHIPPNPANPSLGNKNAKINAAFAWGGVPLAVRTIEAYTSVHIDHVVLVDFAGFQQVTDALGGVDLYIDQDITGVGKEGRRFSKGVQHLNGSEALEYVRQRQQFAGGDFTRMCHQREFLKALLDKAISSDTLKNPLKLNAFLKSVASAMTVDKDFSLADTAFAFRNIGSSDLTMLVSPNRGPDMINKESVVVPDPDRAKSLYDAVVKDTLADWIAQNPPATTTTTTTASGCLNQ
ncbi:LCP family protein [Dactylosporangium fulvum]|uniref:LCP family protein n=2 Tax=Dactylosporangium fulvum TaxID=53359 RepID=A0ABY5W6H1_9ACTN|nr:LCP family protein [Dactylosporangium fulvum]UWP85487.1 LCP family protein [Dactylosporangium fulvum]